MTSDLRGRWETWVRQHVGGDEAQVQAATDAAVRAATQGATSAEAAAAARSVAVAQSSGHDADGTVRLPSPFGTSGQSIPELQNPALESPPHGVDGAAFSSQGGVDSAIIVGHARRVQQRTQLATGASIVLLDFRVDRPGALAVPVEMRGRILEGTIAEDDLVEVPAGDMHGGVVRTDRVYNRTIESEVRMLKGIGGGWALTKATAGKPWAMTQLGCSIVFLIGFLAFFGFIATMIFSSFSSVFPSFSSETGTGITPDAVGKVTVPNVAGKDNVDVPRAGSSSEPVLVPNVVGQSVMVAEQRLNAGGFQTARHPVESTPQNLDLVVAMNPAGQAARGTTIRLDVGAGPAGVEVPNVLGLDRVRAQTSLRQVGLVLSGDQHEQVVQDDNGVGRVLIQDPPAGRRLAKGKSVTITVGVRGTQLQMLDLRGQTPTQAVNTLRKLGWDGTLSQGFTPVSDANQVGVIVSQDVPPGTGFAHDQTITITVGENSTTTTSETFGPPGSSGPG